MLRGYKNISSTNSTNSHITVAHSFTTISNPNHDTRKTLQSLELHEVLEQEVQLSKP